MPTRGAKNAAFAFMVIDHLVKTGTLQTSLGLEIIGKLAFPLFCLSFGAGVAAAGRVGRELRWKRLLSWALLAQLAFPFAFGLHWTSLNMLFVFLVGWYTWKLLCGNRVIAWLAAVALLMITWPAFSAYSYGVFGPLCVAGCLVLFHASDVRIKLTAFVFITATWIFVIPAHALWEMCALALTLLLLRITPPISLSRKLSFAPLYAGHLILIAALKYV